MKRITESAIEELSIELFEKQGFQYIYKPDIAPASGRLTGIWNSTTLTLLLQSATG